MGRSNRLTADAHPEVDPKEKKDDVADVKEQTTVIGEENSDENGDAVLLEKPRLCLNFVHQFRVKELNSMTWLDI